MGRLLPLLVSTCGVEDGADGAYAASTADRGGDSRRAAGTSNLLLGGRLRDHLFAIVRRLLQVIQVAVLHGGDGLAAARLVMVMVVVVAVDTLCQAVATLDFFLLEENWRGVLGNMAAWGCP